MDPVSNAINMKRQSTLYGHIQRKLSKSKVVKRVAGDKIACVALLLRPSTVLKSSVYSPEIRSPNALRSRLINKQDPESVAPVADESIRSMINDYEILYILRAENERDRWGGHVGFPGGRQNPGETDLMTCKREVFEEIGLTLDGNFRLLGNTDDSSLTIKGKKLIVRCFVFGEIEVVSLEKRNSYEKLIRLDAKEVQACGWCIIKEIVNEDNLNLVDFDFEKIFPKLTVQRKMDSLPSLLIAFNSYIRRFLGVERICLSGVTLPVQNVIYSDEKVPEKAFTLWGLTLGMTNDFLYLNTGLSQHTLYATEKISFPFIEKLFFVDKQFRDSRVHNIVLFFFKRSARLILGRPITLVEMVTLYPLFYLIASAMLFGVGYKTGVYLIKSRL